MEHPSPARALTEGGRMSHVRLSANPSPRAYPLCIINDGRADADL